MKLLNSLFAGLLLVSASFAQAASKPTPVDVPNVTVTQIRWHKEVFIPALYDDPMRVNKDRDELERDQKATALQNADRAKQGQTQIPTPPKKIASNTPVGSTPMGTPLGDEPAGNQNLPSQPEPGASLVHYRYEAKIKNTGVKTIKAIVWIYSVSDPDSGIEIGHHRFTYNVGIPAGKTVNLVGRSKTPASSIVQAGGSGKESGKKYSERVVIDRVEYGDGSFWQRAAN